MRSGCQCHPERMSQTPAQLLAKTEDAIAALLDAIGDPMVEEYQIGNRRVRRPDFARTLESLEKARATYKRIVNRSTRSPMRLASLRRARGIDR